MDFYHPHSGAQSSLVLTDQSFTEAHVPKKNKDSDDFSRLSY